MYQAYKNFAQFNINFEDEWTFKSAFFDFGETVWAAPKYGLSAETPSSADDYAGDSSTTGTLTIGGTVSGDIDTANDVDWIAITLTGTTVHITLVAEPGFAGLPFNLVDVNGDQAIATLLNPSTFEYEIFTSGLSGTYYIEYTSQYQHSYQFSAANVAGDYADDISTSGVISASTSAQGIFEYWADSDWFSFSVSAGDLVVFDYQTSVYLGLAPLTLYDASGTALASSGFSGSLGYTFSTGGTYYIGISSDDSVISRYRLNVHNNNDNWRHPYWYRN